jgi:diacylglycerol O-acyltransferase / wax synthase
MTDAGAQPTHREAMSRVDTAWLRMERPTNLMMITGVMMFDTPMSIERLRKTIKQRFLAYPRFTQKAVDTGAATFWETDANFDLEHHVRLTALPGKGGKRELERFTSQMASSPLDQTKPLWQFHLVEKYGGGSALITRIHHCYADGIALVQVLLSLTDTSAEATKASHLDKAWLKHDGEKVKRRFGGVDRAVKTAEKLLGKGMDFYRDPSLAAVLAKEGTDIARELALALSLSDDPQTVFKGRLGITKRVAWAEPLLLEEVKAVGRAFDCTVNDVLLASAAGALRSYMLERGECLEGVTLRATVPVNLRPLEHAQKLGNHFGLVFLELPVGEPNPARRLELVAAHMCLLKTSRQAAATFGALAAVGMAPAGIQSIALEMFSRKASLVATNVPGPQQPLYLAGSKIHEMMFWVPQNGSIGVGISIMSYNGKVHFGLIGDAKLIPDPDAIIQRFRPEFEKLLYVALMARWEDTIYSEDAEAMMIDTR